MNQKSIKIIYLLFMLILSQSIFALKINLANIHVLSTALDISLNDRELETTDTFYHSIRRNEFDGLLKIDKVSRQYADHTIVRSSLEAAELCELLQIDYLLYGFVEKTGQYYNAEIRLFNNETKEDQKTFYLKQELGNYDLFLSQLALKLVHYFYQILGLTEEQKNRQRGFGGIGIYSGVGYWIPMPQWWNIITGVFCIESGFTVIPVTYFARARNFRFNMRFSLHLSYGLGINKPDLLRSYLHTLTIKFPIDLCFELFFNHVLLLGIGPDLVIDFLYQELLYDDPHCKNFIAFGFFTSLKYEYWFGKNKRIALGLNNIFQFTFYDQFLVNYQLQIYNLVRIPIEPAAMKVKRSKN